MKFACSDTMKSIDFVDNILCLDFSLLLFLCMRFYVTSSNLLENSMALNLNLKYRNHKYVRETMTHMTYVAKERNF